MEQEACSKTGLADDVHAENAIRLLLGEEFDLALRVQVRLRTRVCSEGELADVVFHTLGLELLLRLTDPRNLGVCVDDGRDRVVVDIPVAALDEFNRGDTCAVID